MPSRSRLKNARLPGRGFEPLEARRFLYAAAPDLPEGEGIGETVADFSLVDVNPASATYNQPVSPRDLLAQTSLWYFGHAT